MLNLIRALVYLSVFLAARAAVDPDLVGTWSSKSRKVITGPDFYDPVNEKFKEPSHTGISYSFTEDGYYEEAYYRAVANPSSPDCPKGIMQWQHGKYSKEPNGSLILTPFEVDGRQLLSSPCAGDQSAYTRYNQSELFKQYEVQTDKFHNVLRLNLYQFDGTPVIPMYLVYRPPQMLPTQTLNPTAQKPAATGKSKRDISDEETIEPLNKHAFVKRSEPDTMDKWWWFGLFMTSVGGVALILK
ncbi:hypothetical protein CIMG_08168 [Paecilomyces variotii No. 5]|uniref:Protein ROT1 n=1 Tax=Byssochlamys spectabilis (strain No. 5 / NBRC 109023) TaxID=1356009 RepID=V5G1Q2_BYSSN|nr:hypothetical protein CIMG_08168 [Paecilomyces variotii No. 5]